MIRLPPHPGGGRDCRTALWACTQVRAPVSAGTPSQLYHAPGNGPSRQRWHLDGHSVAGNLRVNRGWRDGSRRYFSPQEVAVPRSGFVQPRGKSRAEPVALTPHITALRLGP
jgi:hypothetical protein